jgi:Flp pilus assembly protein TadB
MNVFSDIVKSVSQEFPDIDPVKVKSLADLTKWSRHEQKAFVETLYELRRTRSERVVYHTLAATALVCVGLWHSVSGPLWCIVIPIAFFTTARLFTYAFDVKAVRDLYRLAAKQFPNAVPEDAIEHQ